MATDALRSQITSKWQESFNRLNRNVPGISGLLNFSEVNDLLFLIAALSKQRLLRLGIYPFSIYTLRILGYNLWWVPLISLNFVLLKSRQEDRDLHLAAKAFSVVKQCRRLPALLENFLGESFSTLFYSYVTLA